MTSIKLSLHLRVDSIDSRKSVQIPHCALQDNWVVNSWRVLMSTDLPQCGFETCRRSILLFCSTDWFFFFFAGGPGIPRIWDPKMHDTPGKWISRTCVWRNEWTSRNMSTHKNRSNLLKIVLDQKWIIYKLRSELNPWNGFNP